MWHLKHGANEQKRNKLVDIEKNRLVVVKGKGDGVGWLGSSGFIDAVCCLRNG